MTTARRMLAAVLVLLLGQSTLASSPTGAVDVYHGVRVADPWRWLEDFSDPAVKTWVANQNIASRRYLDEGPIHARVVAAMRRIEAASSVYDQTVKAGGSRLFALTAYPGAQQPVLTELSLFRDKAERRTVFDPVAASRGAVDDFVPSPDGRSIAVIVSEGGSEIGTLLILDAASGRQLGAPIPDVERPVGGGSVAWTGRSDGFWYTKYPHASGSGNERDFGEEVWFHRIGSAEGADRAILTKRDGLPRTGQIALGNRYGAGKALASVQLGDGGEWQHFLLTDSGGTRLAGYGLRIKTAVIARDGTVYALSYAAAPKGRIVRFDPGASNARTIVPPGRDALVVFQLAISGERLFVRTIDGGPQKIVSYGLDGRDRLEVDMPPIAGAGALMPLPDGDLLYQVQTYTTPPRYRIWRAATRLSEDTPLRQTSPMDLSEFDVVRLSARSRDGTVVPMTLIARKGLVRQGRTPTLLYGYGGFGMSETPRFVTPEVYLWLKAGGVYAVVNLRGGAEFGDDWHSAGMLTRKQNVFDDFTAAAEQLKTDGVTSRDELAMLGGSNGGLLMGAVLTQHPDIAHAIVSRVGIYDMLRVERDPNGAYNATEFGSVRDPDQFRALYAYSPLHHVRRGTQYPAVFMATGDNDGRVNPMQSRKFAAALQASGTRAPVFLRTSSGAGHGVGSSLDETVGVEADELTFLFKQFHLTP